MTEWKFENGLDRITAAANPRQLERVPAGACFNFELVYTVERADQCLEDLKNIAIALAILEEDALGGHGGRGYGKVKFQDFKFFYRDISQYQQVAGGGSGNVNLPMQEATDTDNLLQSFGALSEQVQQRLPGV